MILITRYLIRLSISEIEIISPQLLGLNQICRLSARSIINIDISVSVATLFFLIIHSQAFPLCLY